MKIFFVITCLLYNTITFSSAFNMDLDVGLLVDLYKDYLDETLRAEKAEVYCYFKILL